MLWAFHTRIESNNTKQKWNFDCYYCMMAYPRTIQNKVYFQMMSQYLIINYFFSRKDSINIARKKWHDYLGNDYKFFWDVYSNIVQITKLSI